MYHVNLMPKASSHYFFDDEDCVGAHLVRSFMFGFVLTLAIACILGLTLGINYIFYFWLISFTLNCIISAIVDAVKRQGLWSVILASSIGPVVTFSFIYLFIILIFEYYVKGPDFSEYFKKID